MAPLGVFESRPSSTPERPPTHHPKSQNASMNRLTDNDRNFGPLTYGPSGWKKAFRCILSSGGDDEDEEGYRNHLTVYVFNRIFRLQLPNLIRPFVVKVKAGWDDATIARLGRDWYENVYAREYGFSFSGEGFFQLFFGIQSGMGNLPKGVKEQSWCKHLPWTQWRFVRNSLYDQAGNHFWTDRPKNGPRSFDEWHKAKDACPKASFWFEDFDGDIIKATTHIEEREWHFGEGWFSWLSFFRKPLIRRSLDISFSAEVGPEKGSWKGGTTGHGIDMLPGELHEGAFRRYCEMEHNQKGRNFRLKFLGTQEPTKA